MWRAYVHLVSVAPVKPLSCYLTCLTNKPNTPELKYPHTAQRRIQSLRKRLHMILDSAMIAFMYLQFFITVMTLQGCCLYTFPIINYSGALVTLWTPLRLLINPEPRTATSSNEERSFLFDQRLGTHQTSQSRPTQHSPY